MERGRNRGKVKLRGCHGLPSLEMGLPFFFYWVAMGDPVLKWGCLFFYWVAMGDPVLKWGCFFFFLTSNSAVAGCVYMLESVFLYNFKPFGVSDSLGASIGVLSVGNVKLILILRAGSGLTCYDHRVYRFTREVWKARVWLAASHYIESEIKSWLRTSKYIVSI